MSTAENDGFFITAYNNNSVLKNSFQVELEAPRDYSTAHFKEQLTLGTHRIQLQVKAEPVYTKNDYNSLIGVTYKESCKEILMTSTRNLYLLRT
jgi:hypothetical protein